MKLIAPKPFTIESGKRAVLLLHGFTGNTNDVKRLGKYLADRNYTVHAPLYKGHGGGPDLLIQSQPAEWWDSVIEGYDELRNRGYEEIAVAGVSLGGIFSLKLGEERPTKAIVTMSARQQPNQQIVYKIGLLTMLLTIKSYRALMMNQLIAVIKLRNL